MENILIEYELNLSFEEYKNIFLSDNWKMKRIIKVLIFIIIGVLGLFWKYTLICGILIIIIALINLIMPKFIKGTLEKRYSELKYLHDKVIYTINSERIVINGNQFRVETNWKYLGSWKKNNDWFCLYFIGFPEVYIPENIFGRPEDKKQFLNIIKKSHKS